MVEEGAASGLLETLRERVVAAPSSELSEAIEETSVAFGRLTARVKAEHIKAFCRLMRDTPGLEFDFLTDVTAIDWLSQGRPARFEVVYHLWSTTHHHRLCLKCGLPGEGPEIDSVCEVWGGADWNEREVYDMFGVVFRGHPDLRRILMPEDWRGWPLRKDFPAGGTKSFYFKRATHPQAGEAPDLVPRIRVQESDI